MGQPADTVGLYTNDGKDLNWRHLAWNNEISYGIAVRDSVLFLSGLDGVLRSFDNGTTWKLVTDWRMPEAFQVYFHPIQSRTVFMICSTGIWKSDDLGNTWTKLNAGLKNTSQTYVNTLLILPDKLIAGTADGIFEKANNAKKWRLSALAAKEVHDLKEDPYNPKHIVAATEDEGVYESADGGKSWRPLGKNLEGKTVYTIAFDSLHEGILYCGGYKLGLCKYDEKSDSWTQLKNEISHKSIHSIAIEPAYGELYIGLLDYGLYRSSDGGLTVEGTKETSGKIWQIATAP